MIELVIVTPAGESFRGDVESVVLPGSEGDFGVLEHHERFLAPLRIGEVEFRTSDGETVYGSIAGGFADVSGHQVVVLAESAEHSHEIDLARAEMARDRAREGLAKLDRDAEKERFAAYAASLLRAENRLSVGARSRD
ncbi:MAG: ATP synthase F1 subunit epsilon [Myxococcota bacterium]|nr:ATP synthase F1 subunit epsilon [Myxococcota bacterium]